MSIPTPSAGFLHIVVGYDGSPPASRALDGAVRLLQGRTGRLEVVYVAHLTSTVMLSADAIAEMETDFDEIEKDLRVQAAQQLGDRVDWGFQRRQGLITEQLIEVASGLVEAGAASGSGSGSGSDETVVIVVGSSSHAAHRMVGSVAVNLARHSPVPLVIVP